MTPHAEMMGIVPKPHHFVPQRSPIRVVTDDDVTYDIIDQGALGLEIRTPEGSLILHPQVSNSIYLKVEKHT